MEELGEKLCQELMEIEGEARGINFKNDRDFVLRKKGRKGLAKLEAELKRLGCPIKYDQIDTYKFYPVGLRAISLLAIKKVFNMKDKDIGDVCGFATYVSMMVKIYMKFFSSPEALVEKAPLIWREHFSIGEFSIDDQSVEKKYGVVRIKNFKVHPIFCRCLEGYFRSMAATIIQTKDPKTTTCKEVKCEFKGDDFHEFLVKWQ